MESNISPAAARFSHVVIFWTDPAIPNAADALAAGAEKYLRHIPGVLQFHVGRMVPSHRPVVDQSYQVALNLVFPTKKLRTITRRTTPMSNSWKRSSNPSAKKSSFTTSRKTRADLRYPRGWNLRCTSRSRFPVTCV